eukprot:2915016-Amphidinium_carterae.1
MHGGTTQRFTSRAAGTCQAPFFGVATTCCGGSHMHATTLMLGSRVPRRWVSGHMLPRRASPPSVQP